MSCPVFYECTEKKGILGLIEGCKEELSACLGSDFKELDPSKSEGAGEKHLPCVSVDGSTVTVQVGSVLHPMTEEHSIGWIYLETKEGGQLKFLSPNHEPKVEFVLASRDQAVAAYAYCNLHGFWKAEI